jgi:hypothetical protein
VSYDNKFVHVKIISLHVVTCSGYDIGGTVCCIRAMAEIKEIFIFHQKRVVGN